MGNHVKLFKFNPGTRQLVDYLNTGRGVFSRSNTNAIQMNGRIVDPQKQSVIVELLLMKKTQARLQQKCDGIKKMLERANELNHNRISTDVIKSIFSASNDDQLRSAMKQLEGGY